MNESLSMTIMMSRGGAGGSNNNGYNRALQDQILWLEQQLRRVHEEKCVLKKKGFTRRQYRPDSSSPSPLSSETATSNDRHRKKRQEDKDNDDQADEDLLRLANLEQLESRKRSLLDAKSKLESLQRDFDQKLRSLQSDLSNSKERRDELDRTLLARVTELETSLRKLITSSTTDTDNGIDELQLSRRLQEACENAISDFWKEGHRKLEEHEFQLKTRHEDVLQEERRSAEVAVEKQRQKMRSLVKDTAIRERDLAGKARIIHQQEQEAIEEKEEQQRQQQEAKLPRRKRKEVEKERRRQAILEDAGRKAKEEEERLRFHLERELELETERLQRMKLLEDEEKQRCELEELERQRIIQQHAKEQEARRKRNSEENDASNNDKKSNDGIIRSFFKKFLGGGSRSKTAPINASIENFQRRVPWQPITLPPKDIVRITTSTSSSN